MGSIDADAHVLESTETWAYLDERDRRHTPLIVTQTWGPEVKGLAGQTAVEYWVMDNRLHAKDRNVDIADTSAESREISDVSARIDHMDALGIDVQVLYPTTFLRPAVRTAAAELALTRAYNRWLASIWQRSNDRLRWVALPPLASSSDIVRDEMTRARDHGACGIFMRGLEWGRNIADPYFYALYEIASELALAICLHSGNNSIDNHDATLEDTTFTRFLLPGVGAAHSLVEKDVPNRFPDIRWAFVEMGALWIPYVCQDLKFRLRRMGRPVPDNILAANRMYVTVSLTDDVGFLVDYAGDEHLMLGTDYGHHDASSEVSAFSLFRQRSDISAESMHRITDVNPRALYRL